MASGLGSAELWTSAMSAAADRYTIDTLGTPSAVLMERAALGVASVVQAYGSEAVIVCGPGNNGGDGLAVARILHGRGVGVRAIVVTERHNPAVAAQLELARSHGVEVEGRLPTTIGAGTVLVDALLGTGSQGSPRGAIRDALAWFAQHSDREVVAIDVPTGVDVDSGAADELAVRAAKTVTFQRSKPGLHVTPGRDRAGEVVIADIGLVADPAAGRGDAWLIDPRWVSQCLTELPLAAHKNARGHVGVIGGSRGTPGAAILAATAALRAGAGLASLADLDPALHEAVVVSRPELMLATDRTILGAGVLVVGPGATDPESIAGIASLASDPRPVVWDAGSLDVFTPDRGGPSVLTPHPGEAARLLARLHEPSWSSARVQADRVTAARVLARVTGAVVVLKGAGTIVAQGSTLAIEVGGGPSLATAGTGDVLAGAIGGLLARGLDAWTAARIAVHVHALAGDTGPVGLLALELADGLPAALARALLGTPPAGWPRSLAG